MNILKLSKISIVLNFVNILNVCYLNSLKKEKNAVKFLQIFTLMSNKFYS